MIICRAIIISRSVCHLHPYTTIKFTIRKGICKILRSARNFIRGIYPINACIRLRVKVIVAAIFHELPLGYKFPCDCIVDLPIHFEQFSTHFIYSAATFVRTYKFSIYNFIIVRNFKFGKNCAPIYNRLTGCAIRSIFVTYFFIRCVFIQYRQFAVVNMIRRRNRGQFRRYVDCTTKGQRFLAAQSDFPVNNLAIYVNNRLITHIRRSIVSIVYIVITVKRPNAYRNAYKRIINDFAIYRTNFLNRNGKKLRNFIVFKSSYKTVCNKRTFGFPSICGVKF